MVAFLIVFGLLAFGCAVIGWATRTVWSRELVSEIARPAPTARRTVAPPGPLLELSPTPSEPTSAPLEAPTFRTAPAVAESLRHYAPVADPFAHAPPVSQGSTTGLRH